MKKLLIAAGLLSLLACNSAVAAPSTAADVSPAESELQQQQLPITTKELYLEDSRRQKTIPVRITMPEGAGPFPVIIFSHGFFGSRDAYTYLVKYWAEHGYACIQPSHDDSVRWMRERGKTVRFRQMLKQEPTDKGSWINRVADISFIIDSMPLDPDLAGKFDTNRIAVGGHSAGAFTSLLIAGARVPLKDLAPKIASVADSRVKAIIAMSPQGIRKKDSMGFDDKRSYSIGIPTMFMTGDRDQTGFTTADARVDAFKNSPPGAKYFVLIKGANHMTFSGRAQDELANDASKGQRMGAKMFDRVAQGSMLSAYGDDEAHRRLVAAASTLFLDAYIKGDASTRATLEHGGLTSLLGTDGSVQTK